MPPTKSDLLSRRVITVRQQRVILDADLARLYGTTTKAFNQAIRRNSSRFPADFAFQLSKREANSLRSQIVTLDGATADDAVARDSQAEVTRARGRGRHRKFLPWVFTEHGAVMAANVLRSRKAVEMSVYVVRAFIKQREELATNATVLKRLADGARSAEMAWRSAA